MTPLLLYLAVFCLVIALYAGRRLWQLLQHQRREADQLRWALDQERRGSI